MKVVLDTNVFLSGVFFAGHPYAILDAWRGGRIELILSADILAEYQVTAGRLSSSYPDVAPAAFVAKYL